MSAENELFRGAGWLRFWFEPWIETDESWLSSDGSNSIIKLWRVVDAQARREGYRRWCQYFELIPYWDSSSDTSHCELITSPANTLIQVADLLGTVAGARMARASSGTRNSPGVSLENIRWAKQFALACPVPNLSSDERLADAPPAAAGLAIMRAVLEKACPTAWSRLRMRFPKHIAECVELANLEAEPPNDAALRRATRFWKAAMRRIESPPDTVSEADTLTHA